MSVDKYHVWGVDKRHKKYLGAIYSFGAQTKLKAKAKSFWPGFKGYYFILERTEDET